MTARATITAAAMQRGRPAPLYVSMADARPYTPEALAERWDCSAETVRALIREGRLPAFRVGRMMRIAARVVEDFECGTIGSEGSKADGSSCGTMTESAAVFALRQTRPRKQRGKPAT